MKQARDSEGYLQPVYPADVWRRSRVYIVRAGESGPVKVGFSNNIELRLRQLQTAQPTKLIIEALFVGTTELEATIHRKLERQGLHVRGEWFALDQDAVKGLLWELGEDGLIPI